MNSRLAIAKEVLDPLLGCKVDFTTVDFSNEKPSPRLRVSRHALLSVRTVFIVVTTVATITMSYVSQSWKMDRESADAMRALDLDVAPSFYGTRTIDYFGRLRRADTNVVCKTVNVDGLPLDYSESGMCMQNAQLHANCIRVCDSSFSFCGGCDALAAEQANQLAIAQSHCNPKLAAVCPLTKKTDGSGQYDYFALSTCCLGAAGPVGADACLCTSQQSASASCILNGVCQGPSVCKTSSLICTGTSSASAAPVCTVPGAVPCTGTGSSEVDTKCGNVGGSQYYLNPTTSQCVSSCAAGLVNTVISGVRTCTSCSGAGVTTCSSSGAATSCGAVGNTQYYLRNSLCVLICPGGTWGSVSGNTGTCATCSAGVTICKGSTAYQCGTAGGVQYYLEPTTSTCVIKSSCLTGYTGILNSGGNYQCTLNCIGTGVATCSGSTAYSCGVASGVQYFLEPTTSSCVTAAHCSSGYTAILNGGGNHECALNCPGVGAVLCNDAIAYKCGVVSGVQMYLEPTTSTCVTASNCVGGYHAILNGRGNYECQVI